MCMFLLLPKDLEAGIKMQQLYMWLLGSLAFFEFFFYI